MKKVMLLITVSGFLFYSSCSNNKTQKQGHNPDTRNETSTNTKKDDSIDFLSLGNELMQNEKLDFLKKGLPAKDFQNNLGKPEEESKPEIWAADGRFHQKVKYPSRGIELDLIQEKDSSFVINMITITSPCEFKTKKNIGIESDYLAVKSAYKKYIDPKLSAEDQIVAGSIYGGIIFNFENQKVKSIFIGAAAE